MPPRRSAAGTPVPVAVRRPGLSADAVQTFDEVACLDGALGRMKGRDLMDLLFREVREEG